MGVGGGCVARGSSFVTGVENARASSRVTHRASLRSVEIGFRCAADGAASSDTLYSVGNGVSAPRLLRKVDAAYSEAGRAAGLKGAVVLKIVVDTKGDVADANVVEGLGLGLDEKAIEAVKQWRFKPAYKEGKPVAVLQMVEMSFVLQ